MNSFFIRDCRPEEAEAVLALWRDAETIVSVTDTVEDIRHAIESSAWVLVAEADGCIVGSVIAAFDGWRGNMYRLAVHLFYLTKTV